MAEVAVETKAAAIMARWRRFLAIKEGEEGGGEEEEEEHEKVAGEEVEEVGAVGEVEEVEAVEEVEEEVERNSVDAALRVKSVLIL